MFVLIVLLSMFVLPIGSALVELFVFKSPIGILALLGKWAVFWAVGVRLFTAGLRQAINPEFTAREILGISGKEPLQVIQELGFANISMGLLGLLTLLQGNWTIPAAISGGLFYGLAGIRHIFKAGRNPLENVAMLSDLVMALFLAGFFIQYLVR